MQTLKIPKQTNGVIETGEIGVSVDMLPGELPRLTICSGSKKDGMFSSVRDYRVKSLDLSKAKMDGLGFTLVRTAEDIKEGEPEEYHIFLSEDKNYGDLCDCQGFYRYRRCKHIPAMRFAVGDAE